MNRIISQLQKNNKFNELLIDIENKNGPITLSGLSDVAKSLIVSGIYNIEKKDILLITYNELQAKKIVQDLKYFNKNVLLFNKKEIVTYNYVAENFDAFYDRIKVLNELNGYKRNIIVTSVEAILQKMIPKEVLYKNRIKLSVGKSIDIEDLKQKFIYLGYERVEIIEGNGQFCIRGGIIDVSIDDSTGVRIELWGDEIDSIRYFSISSQRSTQMLNSIEINPLHEYVLENSIDQVCEKILKSEYLKNQFVSINDDIEVIKHGDYVSKIDKYIDEFYSKTVTLLDYLNNEYLVIFDEINKIEARCKNISVDYDNLIKSLAEKNKLIPQILINRKSLDDIQNLIDDSRKIYVENNEISKNNIKYRFKFRDVTYYKSEVERFLKDVNNYVVLNKKVYLIVDTKDKAKKLSKILYNNDILNIVNDNEENNIVQSNKKIVSIEIGKLSNGFEDIDTNTVIIDCNNILDIVKKRRRVVSNSFKEGEKVVYADLKQGDYIVHRSHGIGEFIGVNTITSDGITKDYIKIKYKNDDMLYIPTNQLDAVRKYIGGDGVKPKINSLRSKDWEKTKNKVKNNLRTVAKELIELYAKRQNLRGYAFSKDTLWQEQFENDFPYQETDDQIRCIEEVKKDMELQKPMDRLLCGDVGYGKTEVAIRAAFKAVMDQKQVAYLAPTTVLANQQYESFRDRMKEFPIRVEVLNRFRTKKEQNVIIKKLKLGEIDIIIGTHRILSDDVGFKDLGLLIVDEEHRFGVKAKEKIKQYKNNVDVLTMTATPIPRTLHMSVVGVRDMSVIYEPPQNRKPVQTYVLEYDDEIIREAITKELERKGQVFYLYNNVEGIERKAIQIQNLIPEAKIAYAHGQMSGIQLENIMEDFIKGKYDILVCTTILESGIDIPNANTIIVENADRLGLAQLYQIRGRVGRSSTQAYAYITYKRDKILSEISNKRLKAIKEFTQFGSGFKIAMRDLEIRGAGSLIGEIQHGHLEQVGYETYCSLLDEVIKEMKGIEVEEEQDIQIDLNVSSYIPDEYIYESSQKIEVYQNIALCKNEEDIQNVIDEVIDRYGNIPDELENLIDISRIKMLCKKNNIIKISQRMNNVVFTFDRKKFNLAVINDLLKIYRNRIKFSTGNPYITLKIDENNDKRIITEIKNFLKNLK